MKDNFETRNYPAQGNHNQPRRHAQKPPRKNRGKQTFLIALVVILLAILMVALFYVIRDIVIAERESQTGNEGTQSSVTTSGDNSPSADPKSTDPKFVIDGDDSTYMISESNQAVGAYLAIDIGSSVSITNVRIVSNDAKCYVRRADVQTSEDGENWTYFAQYTGSASNPIDKSVTKGSAVFASYVRLILTEKADEKWLIQSIYVDTADSSGIALRSAKTGVEGGSTVTTLTGVPASTTAPVQSGYKAISKLNADMYTGNLIVVNANHEYVFPTSIADIIPMYSARPEVTLGGKTVMAYKVGGSELPSMKAEALTALNSLAIDFVNETKLTSLEIGTNDAWRSRETQAELYAKYPTSASKTGFSEHNTGLGVNFNIMDDKGGIYSIGSTENADCVKAYSWLSINAYKYGFVERFKASKKSITGVTDNYHFRYVGVGHAYYMSQNNLCLEEYIDLLHTYTYGGNHLCFNADGINYEIYYIAYNKNAKSTEVYVPTDASYTISGDNYSGFIVTITR